MMIFVEDKRLQKTIKYITGSGPWVLAVVPICVEGMIQVLRGPSAANIPGWQWCSWRKDWPSPGGWPAIQRYLPAPPWWVSAEDIQQKIEMIGKL